MNSYWIQHPPAHLLIAMYIGYKPSTGVVNDPKEMEALMGALQAQ